MPDAARFSAFDFGIKSRPLAQSNWFTLLAFAMVPGPIDMRRLFVHYFLYYLRLLGFVGSLLHLHAPKGGAASH